MAMVTMFPFPSQHHGLTHWKCVIHCCDKRPSISIPRQEKNTDTKTFVQQYVFVLTAIYHSIMFMEYAHMKNEKHVLCVLMVLFL